MAIPSVTQNCFVVEDFLLFAGAIVNACHA